VNPISTLQAIGAAIAAFVIGLALGALPAYFIGKGHGAANKAEAVGALKVSVDSCTDAAKAAETAAKTDKAQAEEREQRIAAAIEDNARSNREALARIAKTQAYKPRGDTECEQLTNAVDDLYRRKP
jgi:hypothetical protein